MPQFLVKNAQPHVLDLAFEMTKTGGVTRLWVKLKNDAKQAVGCCFHPKFHLLAPLGGIKKPNHITSEFPVKNGAAGNSLEKRAVGQNDQALPCKVEMRDHGLASPGFWHFAAQVKPGAFPGLTPQLAFLYRFELTFLSSFHRHRLF